MKHKSMITLPIEIRKQLKDFSTKNGQTMSGVICQALREHFFRQGKIDGVPEKKEKLKAPKIHSVQCTDIECKHVYTLIEDTEHPDYGTGCPDCGRTENRDIY